MDDSQNALAEVERWILIGAVQDEQVDKSDWIRLWVKVREAQSKPFESTDWSEAFTVARASQGEAPPTAMRSTTHNRSLTMHVTDERVIFYGERRERTALNPSRAECSREKFDHDIAWLTTTDATPAEALFFLFDSLVVSGSVGDPTPASSTANNRENRPPQPPE